MTIDLLVSSEFQVVTFFELKADGSPDLSKPLHRLPVPHQQMTVSQAIRVDESRTAGRSGKRKQASGYECATVSIAVELHDIEDNGGVVTTSSWQQYADIQAMFRDKSAGVADGTAVRTSSVTPRVYGVQSAMLDACGIATVQVKSLTCTDRAGETSLDVKIELEEYEPQVVQREKSSTGGIDPYYDYSAQSTAEDVYSYDAALSASVAQHQAAAGAEESLGATYRSAKASAMGGTP